MARLRLAVLGGTFDPPHLGHLILAHCAFAQLALDRVLFIPAGDPWRKADRTVTAAGHRLEMVRLATSGDARFVVDDRETRRNGPTYSVDTLRELRAELGEVAEMYFLAGEDALDDMPYWREPEAMLALARLAVAPRMATATSGPTRDVAATRLQLPQFEHIDMPYIGISSTDLRARAGRGESLRYLVPEEVARYITERALYRRPAPA